MLKIIAPISTVSLLGAFFAPDLIQTGLLIIGFSLATSYLIWAGNPRRALTLYKAELIKAREAVANAQNQANVVIQSAKDKANLIVEKADQLEASANSKAEELRQLAKKRARRIVRMARESLQDELDGERAARTNELNNLSVQIQSAIAQLEKLEDLKSRTEAGIAKLKLQAQEEYAATHKSLQEAANRQIREREEYWGQIVTELQSVVDALKSENLELENRIYEKYEPKYPVGWSYPETCARTIQGLYHKEWKIILDYRGSSFDGDGATVIISLIPREPGTEIAKIFRRAREIGQALDTIDDPLLERVGSAIVFKFVPSERGMMPVGMGGSAAVAHLLEGDEP